MKTPIDRLLESNQPAIRYRTLLDVVDRPSSDEEARRTFAQITKGMGCSRRITKSIERGAEFFLNRKLFREGVRIYPPWFRFQYPVHYYYDLLVGLEVLSSLGYGKDPRMKFALELLQKKKRADGYLELSIPIFQEICQRLHTVLLHHSSLSLRYHLY